MPSFQDSAVIFFIALLLFGPKKLPELARQLGKLMGEFRRASNEFRMQMEDELRASEQAEKQKQIAAMEAAAPVAPAITSEETNTIGIPGHATERPSDLIEDPMDSHPHMQLPDRHTGSVVSETVPEVASSAPVPIASSGELNLMPPATGLPVGRSMAGSESSALSPMFDAIPVAPEHNGKTHGAQPPQAALPSDEAVTHG